jgi:hypothetical protein
MAAACRSIWPSLSRIAHFDYALVTPTILKVRLPLHQPSLEGAAVDRLAPMSPTSKPASDERPGSNPNGWG